MQLYNQVTAPNCRPALQFRCAGFFGRCIRWQRPFPAAVGEFYRYAHSAYIMWPFKKKPAAEKMPAGPI
jgi:hypothetical protein